MMRLPAKPGAVCVWLIASAALAHPTVAQEKPPAVASAWVREPSAGQASTPAFVSINNPGMYEVWIVSATADASSSVELREAKKDDPAAAQQMKEVNIPAYGSLDMTPSGVHLRLVGLTRPLKAGDHVSLSLKTDSGAILKADATVR